MIKSNAANMAGDWLKRARSFESEMKTATAEATKLLLSESKSQMTQLIYNKPVPTRAQVAAEKGRLGNTGRIGVAFAAKNKSVGFVTSKKYATKPAWKRTGNLRRSERMEIKSSYVGLVVNDAKSTGRGKSSGYAAARHDMDCRYPAPWRANAINRVRGKIRALYRAAVRRVLTSGGPSGFRMAAGGGG